MPGAVISGTFCIAHSELLQLALRGHGHCCIAEHDELADPFALLLHRVKHPDAVILTTQTDTVRHPEVRRLLMDLAIALLPPGGLRTVLRLDVDPHELFYHMIQTGFTGSFGDMMSMDIAPVYSTPSTESPGGVRCLQVPPFAHATPVMLAQIVCHVISAIKTPSMVEAAIHSE
jgi:hypothetical protein